MLKKTAILYLTFLLTISGFSQDAKKEVKGAETKMDAFLSKTGTLIKFVDYNLPNLMLLYGEMAETRVRKISSGSESHFFYQIEKQGKYGSSIASIEYSDLLEVIKAMKVLKADANKDIPVNPDYLENKFVTDDGFQVGYYISSGKITWYLKLQKYGSDNTLIIKYGGTIDTAFDEAKTKIEELKK